MRTSDNAKAPLLFITKIMPQAEMTGGHLYPYSILSYLSTVGFDVNVLLLENWTVHGLIPFISETREGVPFRFLFPKYYRFGRWLWHPSGILCNLRIKLSKYLKFIRPTKSLEGSQWWAEISQNELELVRAAARSKKWKVVISYPSCSSPALDLFNYEVHKVVMAMDAFHTNSDPLFSAMTYEKEQELLAKGETIIAINEKEAAIFRNMLPDKQVVCARTAYSPHFSSSPPKPGRLLFLGSNYQPNISGASWFIKQVGPLLEKLAPGHFSLNLVGDCGDHLRNEDHGFRVCIKGRVADLEKEYRDAEIVIAPIFAGSGVSAKVVEAIAYGKSVVATSMGARGLEDLIGKPILLADNPQDFAAKLMELSFDGLRRGQLEAAARETTLQRLSPEASYRNLAAILSGHARG
jgi:glycosyltransferase involved in cell wall biosynthesis